MPPLSVLALHSRPAICGYLLAFLPTKHPQPTQNSNQKSKLHKSWLTVRGIWLQSGPLRPPGHSQLKSFPWSIQRCPSGQGLLAQKSTYGAQRERGIEKNRHKSKHIVAKLGWEESGGVELRWNFITYSKMYLPQHSYLKDTSTRLHTKPHTCGIPFPMHVCGSASPRSEQIKSIPFKFRRQLGSFDFHPPGNCRGICFQYKILIILGSLNQLMGTVEDRRLEYLRFYTLWLYFLHILNA